MRRASLLQPGGGCLKCAKLQAIVFALTSDVKRREDALSVLHEITNHKLMRMAKFAEHIADLELELHAKTKEVQDLGRKLEKLEAREARLQAGPGGTWHGSPGRPGPSQGSAWGSGPPSEATPLARSPHLGAESPALHPVPPTPPPLVVEAEQLLAESLIKLSSVGESSKARQAKLMEARERLRSHARHPQSVAEGGREARTAPAGARPPDAYTRGLPPYPMRALEDGGTAKPGGGGGVGSPPSAGRSGAEDGGSGGAAAEPGAGADVAVSERAAGPSPAGGLWPPWINGYGTLPEAGSDDESEHRGAEEGGGAASEPARPGEVVEVNAYHTQQHPGPRGGSGVRVSGEVEAGHLEYEVSLGFWRARDEVDCSPCPPLWRAQGGEGGDARLWLPAVARPLSAAFDRCHAEAGGEKDEEQGAEEEKRGQGGVDVVEQQQPRGEGDVGGAWGRGGAAGARQLPPAAAPSVLDPTAAPRSHQGSEVEPTLGDRAGCSSGGSTGDGDQEGDLLGSDRSPEWIGVGLGRSPQGPLPLPDAVSPLGLSPLRDYPLLAEDKGGGAKWGGGVAALGGGDIVELEGGGGGGSPRWSDLDLT